MSNCNLVIRINDNIEKFIGITFDVHKHHILINEDRNKRWIKENIRISFFDWLIEDVKTTKYKIIYEIPFYGTVSDGTCTLLSVQYLENTVPIYKNLGVYTKKSNPKEILEEYHISLWEEYISEKNWYRGRISSISDFNIKEYEEYIDYLKINTIESEEVKI